MILTRKETKMAHFKIRREIPGFLEFDGTKLAEQSSRQDESMQRWTEIRIYRTTSKVYVIETVGKSTRPGERDLISIKKIERAEDVSPAMYLTQNGKRFLTDLALDALEEAAQNDSALGATEKL